MGISEVLRLDVEADKGARLGQIIEEALSAIKDRGEPRS